MMQDQGGLLGQMMQGQQMSAAPSPSGILGSASAGAPQPMAPEGKQMAMELSQNPTPEVVQKIVQKLHQSGNQSAQQLEQLLMQHVNDPDALRAIAQSVIQG